MPELRTDWLSGRTVIIAEDRAGRPNDFGEIGEAAFSARVVARLDEVGGGTPTTSADCPFCPGNEERTPPSVDELSNADGHWQVRVVPNMFPAVTMPQREELAAEAVLPRFGAAAVGTHEVIIESARHIARTSQLSVEELGGVLEMYRRRLRHWRENPLLRYGLVFKNQGPRAGASLAHLHSQLVAMPDVPPAVAAEQGRAQQAFAEQHACPYCRLIDAERSAGERVVLDRDGLIAFCPHASWQPFEVWLMPVEHQPAFEAPCDAARLDSLTRGMHELIGRVESIVPAGSYNLLVRTSPWRSGGEACGHWRIELLPRVSAFAGLELATGVHINPLSPERAARHYRSEGSFPGSGQKS